MDCESFAIEELPTGGINEKYREHTTHITRHVNKSLFSRLGKRVAGFLEKRDRKLIDKYEEQIANPAQLYTIIEEQMIPINNGDVRAANMQISKLGEATLVKFKTMASSIISGYAIYEYACTMAMKMRQYDESRAHQIYMSLTYANLSVSEVFQYKADTMYLSELMCLQYNLDRNFRSEISHVIYEGYNDRTEKIIKKKLRAAVFRMHIKDRNYAAAGIVVFAAFFSLIVCLIPALAFLPKLFSQVTLKSNITQSAQIKTYPVVGPDEELKLVPVPKSKNRRNYYTLPYIEDDVYGRHGVIEKPQYEKTSVSYKEPSDKLPTRHYLLGDPGACYFYYDRHDPINYCAAAHGRLFVDNGPGLLKNEYLIPYMETAAHQLAHMLTPMDESYDYLSTENRLRWIASRPYCATRKCQMTQAVLSGEEKSRVEPFLKDEGYPMGNKPPRMICARDDLGKTIYGPLFQSMNDELFHLPFATKHIPNAERPKYITEHLFAEGDYVYVVTDMSAFECAMRKHLQVHCEMVVYKHIIPSKYHHYLDALLDPVVMRTRNGVTIKTPALRLSGEMNTSLGNTITNVVSIETCASVLGLTPGSYAYVCEGDDALLRLPRSVFYGPDGVLLDRWSPIMRDLGFNIKIENLGMPLGVAGYCSTYWDEELNIVINPVKAIMTFYIGNNYMDPKEQLRMKALNYAISAPGEPILTALCKYYLSGNGIARMCWSMYYLEERGTSWQLRVDDNGDLITTYTPRIVEPSPKQRKFFEEMYNITPERQIALEELILRDPHLGFEAVLDEFDLSEEYREQYESQLRNPYSDVPPNTCSVYDEVRFNNKPWYHREHFRMWAAKIGETPEERQIRIRHEYEDMKWDADHQATGEH